MWFYGMGQVFICLYGSQHLRASKLFSFNSKTQHTTQPPKHLTTYYSSNWNGRWSTSSATVQMRASVQYKWRLVSERVT